MASITDLQSNTTGVNSRTIINDNFDELNTEKVERDGSIPMTGKLSFTGTTHAGVQLVSLTTTERDALTPVNGDIIYNETTNQVEAYENGAWVGTSAGVADASLTTKGVAEAGTTAEIDANSSTGTTGANIFVRPDQLANSKYGTQLPSSAQKSALAGTSGTPGDSNRYVTDDDTATTSTADAVVRGNGSGKVDNSWLNDGVLESTTKTFTAGENISAGDAVIVTAGTATESQEASYEDTAENRTFEDTNWHAQTFPTTASAVAISKLEINTRAEDNPGTYTIIVSLRETSAGQPTGSDLQGQTATITLSGNSSNTWRTLIFSEPILVDPSTTYAIVVRRPDTTLGTVRWNGDDTGYADGAGYVSTDSGATWSLSSGVSNADDFAFRVFEGTATPGEIYKADASLDNELANNFIGFAEEAITDGNSGLVNIGGIDSNQSGLSPGFTYYLSDTAGEISATPGTQSRPVGLSVSSTEILIKHENN